MSLTAAQKEYVAQLDRAVESKVKIWVLASLLSNVAMLVPVIFYLGGIYQQGKTALELLKAHQAELSTQSDWNRDRELHDALLDEWATDKGFRGRSVQR